MRKLLLQLAKLGVSLAILIYLVAEVRSEDPAILSRLFFEPKEWNLLWAAYVCFVVSLLTTFCRWRFLVRSIGVNLSVPEVIRLGLTAYTFDFVGLGTPGGDLIRATLLAQRRPGARARVVATVIVDRMVGLAVLLVSTSALMVATGLHRGEGPIRTLVWATVLFTSLGMVSVGAICAMRLWIDQSRLLDRLPIIGRPIASLVEALLLFREGARALGLAALLSAAALCLNVWGFYLISSSLAEVGPSLQQHFVIVPLALVGGALPLPMKALGALDYTLSYLYETVSDGNAVLGRGLFVAMAYRVLGASIAAVGACYGLFGRRAIGESRIEERG